MADGDVRLLVATPVLVDPNFHRSVVFLLERGPEGALGVVLNRPSPAPLAQTLPQWEPLATAPAVVYSGGPVATSSALCLARRAAESSPRGFQPVRGPVGAIDPDADPDQIAPAVSALRVFAGYAGWAAGQLDGEVAAGAWLELPDLPDDVFTAHPDRLWADVLRRQGPPIALLATHPGDPRLN